MYRSPGVNVVDVVELEVDEEAELVVVEVVLGAERRATRSRTSSRALGRIVPLILYLYEYTLRVREMATVSICDIDVHGATPERNKHINSCLDSLLLALSQPLDLALQSLLDPQEHARLPVVQLGDLVVVEHGFLERLDVALFASVHHVLCEFGFPSGGESDVFLGE